MRRLAPILLALGLSSPAGAVGTVDAEPDLVPLLPKAAPADPTPKEPASSAPPEKKPLVYPRLIPWKQLGAPPPDVQAQPAANADAPAPHGKCGTAPRRLGRSRQRGR